MYVPLFAPLTDDRPNSFSPSILPSLRNFFTLLDFNCHHPLWDSRSTSDHAGRKFLTKSFLLTFSLKFPLLSPLLPFLAPGRCFRTWVLTTYQFFYLSLSPVLCPNERPPSFNFLKACWDDFASYFDSRCPSAEEYSSLSSAAALFGTECGQISISFGCI